MRWNFWRRQSRNRDLEEEIAFDLAAEAAENLRAGMSPKEAQLNSRKDFGNVLLVEEATREMWGWMSLERLLQDLKYGLRMLARNPAFTAIAVLSLALGIGANTAIYSFMDAILLRALPVADPQSLVSVQWHTRTQEQPRVIHAFSLGGRKDPKTGFTSMSMPYGAYEVLAASPVLAQTFAFAPGWRHNVQVRGQADLGQAEFVSGTFFSGLGLAPSAGRLIDADDDRPGAPHVAVLSFRYAQRRFGDSTRAAGQTVRIDEKPFTIVGVAPPEFFGVDPEMTVDLYLPLHANLAFDAFGGDPNNLYNNANYYWLQVLARVRPGIPRRQAEAALVPLFHNFVASTARTSAERADLPSVFLVDGAGGLDYLRHRYSRPLYVLIAMSGLILALACANIANLMLARASTRRREMAVRLSVGAGRARVVRQLLTESVLLSSAGGLAGVLLADRGIRVLTWLLSGGTENFTLRAALNWHVLAVSLALSLATGLLFGLAPALEATRVDLVHALKQLRTGSQRLRLHRWLRINLSQALVVAQMAISLLLVVGGGLFVHTLVNLHAIDLGFNQEHLLLFSVDAKQVGYSNDAAKRFYDDLQARVQAIPGVRAASVSSFGLLSGGMTGWDIYKVEGYTGRVPSLYTMNVGPGFFSTMQIPILLGREFQARDSTNPAAMAVVNEVFARTFFPGQNPIGRRIIMGGDIEIIGVARNARYDTLKRELPPLAYFCSGQRPRVGQMTFEVRAAGDPMGLAGAIRQVVHEADSRIPVQGMTTQDALVASTISQERTFASLCAGFALLAVLIACVGIYGMMAYRVARRTNEIGIRMALGAARAPVLWMVLREALVLCAVGLAIGVPAAFAGARLLQSFLFQMKARDPLTMWLAPAVLLAAALVAGYGPAWRASRIDPWTALRDE